MVRLALFCSLLLSNVVASVPFQKGSMVNTVTCDKDTVYAGGSRGELWRMVCDENGRLVVDGKTSGFVPGYHIKSIAVKGDALYVCSRSNGYGLGVDYKHPDYLFPFEDADALARAQVKGRVEAQIADDPCPGRFCKSLHIIKHKGVGSYIISQQVPQAHDCAEFMFWIKIPSKPAGMLDLPLVKDLFSVCMDGSGKMGLKLAGKCSWGKYHCPLGAWVNVKFTASQGVASLCVRSAESPAEWTEVCSETVGEFSYDSISCGVEGKSAADILIDEFAYAATGIEDKCFVNGALTVLDKKTFEILSQYKLDLRGLSLLLKDNILYMGMIGGVNIYDISNPCAPSLVSAFRDPAGRYWDYPQKCESLYKWRVPGQECQRMDLMELPDGRKILVGGCDTHGIILIDVTDPANPILHDHIRTTPLVEIEGSDAKKKKYIEWGVCCDYPYIYTSVASLHSLVHTDYFSGKYTPRNWTPDIYGIKVYDISNPADVKDTLVLAPREFFPTHIAPEGDSCPNEISRIGDKLYLNFSEHGVAVFNADGFNSSFEGMIGLPGTGRVRCTCPTDKGGLVVGDGAIFGPWQDCNVYLLGNTVFSQVISKMNDWSLSVECDRQQAQLLAKLSDYGRENSADMRELFLKVPVEQTELEELAALQREDGSFSDIDYADPNRGYWQPAIHCFRVQRLAIRYARTGDTKSLDMALKAMRYWHAHTPVCPNWWHNEIGCPRLMGPAYLLLRSDMTAEDLEGAKVVMGKAKIGMSGQNKVWLAGNVLIRALLTEDYNLLLAARNAIDEELRIGERGVGIQQDYSFHQHGKQLQFGNYGLSFAVSLSYWANVLGGTDLAFPSRKTDILVKYIREGLGQMIYNGWFDHNACARQVFRNAQQGKALCVLQAAANMGIDIPCSMGGRYWPYSDFAVYRGNGWYASLRMQSRHLKGFEMTNGENMQGYFSSDGCLLIRRAGDEYNDISPVWNWRHIPGATTWDDGTPLWGGVKGHANDEVVYNDTDKISVAEFEDGCMAVAMEYVRDGVTARKAWFFFADGVVCLGSGISCEHKVRVMTTIDQKFAVLPVTRTGNRYHYGEETVIVLDGNVVDASGLHKGSWSRIAPYYPEVEESANLVDLYIDHGIAPSDATYAYIVVENPDAVENIANRIEILENTPQCQSLRLDGIECKIRW